ncbi:peptidoglycan DD-metalloendopeptidase family protein [Rothia nasimurium]|uniref:peptidoglycan DD-metalloendopeptidase family protein n=1 Tax=Rothia nasimurium TaxID=85336 RepID=UPI001F1C6D4E|nr:peptidoglycan DD-metalloendopeptidase family protein [Rothia nasimurium]
MLDNGVVIDETTWFSPNFTPAAQVPAVYGLPRTIDGVTVHWWNDPALNPTFDGSAAYLSRAGGNTSAHFIVQGNRVACIVSPVNAAWHAGSARGNATTVGIEMAPWATDADMQTLASLIRWLEKTYGKSLMVYQHKDWTPTACPGAYSGKIGQLVAMVNAGPGATPAPAAAATPAPSTAGMVYPVTGYTLTQAFNGGRSLATNLGGGHTGVDWATPVGTPVKAVADGTVLFEDWAQNLPTTSWADRWYLTGGGYTGIATDAGIVVVIDHGGYLSISAHLSETKLHKGDRVTRGQEIGKTGNTGYTTGPHLHFEILPKPFAWSNGFYGRTDPITFIQARQATAPAQKDWLDMATREDVKAALREVFEAPFRREGPEAAKAWPHKDQTSSFGAVLRWTDESWIQLSKSIAKVNENVTALGKRLDALEAKPAAVSTTAVQGVTVEQLRALIREEIDRTKLGAK